jgi:hypothetical protein
MKLRSRFLLGYLLVALVTAILGFFALRVFDTMNDEVTLLQEDVLPGAISMLETSSVIKSLMMEVEEFSEDGNPQHREHASEAMALIRKNMTEHTARQKLI